jgi:hypothetical protein
MGARLVFPETPVADDGAYLRELERRAFRAAHWRRGWRWNEHREGGVVARISFGECPPDCPCEDDEWWGDGK